MSTAVFAQQGLVLAIAAATALLLRWGLGLPRPRRVAGRRYTLANLKAAEDAIVRDALSGAVQYRRWTAQTGMQLVLNGVADSADVVVRRGHGGSVGMSIVVRVNGVDVSHQGVPRFDTQRVAAAVLDGHDLWAGPGDGSAR